MKGRVAVYYAWSRLEEVGAPLETIENRFPTLFEIRRMLYPRFAEMSDRSRFNQSVAGFLDHILKANFAAFIEQASAQSGNLVIEQERTLDNGTQIPLSAELIEDADTLIVISFDSLRSGQRATEAEITFASNFLSKPGNLLVISPHHDIGHSDELGGADLQHLQEATFLHHGDKTIPPQQRFGGFGRSLLAGLGVPVENRFGLHPAALHDGSPMPIEVDSKPDRFRLLEGVKTFNLHPHLPHLERLGDALNKMDVLVRQRIDLSAPPHPFTQTGRTTFDALLQSKPNVFTGDLLVSDATLWSSTAGGVESLQIFWRNVVGRKLTASVGDSPLCG